MYCKKCGNAIPTNTQSCPHCGRQADTSNISALLRRALLFLEEGQNAKADDYCERVLDEEPENAQAYVIKLMIRAGVKREEDLASAEESFATWNSYQNALRFADSALSKKLTFYLQSVEESIRQKGLKAIAEEKEAQEKNNAEIYHRACYYTLLEPTISNLNSAVKLFNKIPEYLDSAERANACNAQLKELKALQEKHIQDEKSRKHVKRNCWIIGTVICLCIALWITVTTINNKNEKTATNLRTYLSGLSFTGSYSDYTTTGNNAPFSAINSMKKYNVTYHFRENGSVQVSKTTRSMKFSGNGVYLTDENGEAYWTSPSTSSYVVDSYDIDVSFFGDVTITVDSAAFEANLNYDGFPTSLLKGNITYYRD